MDDREAVAAIVAGDPAGLADVYDRYAASLYGYCKSMLREPADAADAVQDTFVIAAARLDALREPRKLRPWLYAVARNECLRKLRSREAPAEIAETEDAATAAEVGQSAQRRELRELVRAAVCGLNPPDREAIELNRRHDLAGGDLAAVLGVSRRHAHAIAARARAQLERSLGALLVARTGRRACPALDMLLADWDGRLTVLLRKRVSRHIDQCDECAERKRDTLRPAMLFGFPALPLVPPSLRHQMLRLCTDQRPTVIDARRAIARQAGPFGGPGGFPRPLRPGGAGRRASRGLRDPGAGLTAAAAVAAAAAVIITMIALRGSPPSTLDARSGSNGNGGAGTVVASSTAGPTAASSSPSATPSDSMAAMLHPPGTGTSPVLAPTSPARSPNASRSPRPTKSPKPTRSPTHSPSASPSASASASPTATPSPTPTTSPSPSPSSSQTTTTPPPAG